MLDEMRMRVMQHTPRQITAPGLPEAGVLIAITSQPQPEIILTQLPRKKGLKCSFSLCYSC